MIARCTNRNNNRFGQYGGRGITVCQRWLESFVSFLDDMGVRPSSEHSIDRIDNDGNYEPGNCRWATRVEQSRNTQQNMIIEAFGRRQCLQDWSIETGIGRGTIRWRVVNGWSPEMALTAKTKVRGMK
jgi:hypothetical protein